MLNDNYCQPRAVSSTISNPPLKFHMWRYTKMRFYDLVLCARLIHLLFQLTVTRTVTKKGLQSLLPEKTTMAWFLSPTLVGSIPISYVDEFDHIYMRVFVMPTLFLLFLMNGCKISAAAEHREADEGDDP